MNLRMCLIPALCLAGLPRPAGAGDDEAWTRLAGVEDNREAHIALKFDPVEVTRLRLLARPPAAGDHARVGEIVCMAAWGRVRPVRIEVESTREGFSAAALDDGVESFEEGGSAPRGWASGGAGGPAWIVLHFARPTALAQVRVTTDADPAKALAALEAQASSAEVAAGKSRAASRKASGAAPGRPAARPVALPPDRLESLGEFRVTRYYLAEQTNYEGEDDTDVLDPSGKVLARVPAKFAAFMHIQGCGKLRDGRLLTYVSNKRYVVSKSPYGRGVGYDLEPFRSVAVDKTLIPLGTKLYIKEMVGAELPDGRIHDGIFRAHDTGGGVKGAHVDLFAGVKGWTSVFAKQGVGAKITVYKVKEETAGK